MTGSNRYKILYYSVIAVVSFILITFLVSLLNWPLLAEIALGCALWIHALILSRSIKDLFLSALEKGMLDELLYTLKATAEVGERNTKP